MITANQLDNILEQQGIKDFDKLTISFAFIDPDTSEVLHKPIEHVEVEFRENEAIEQYNYIKSWMRMLEK